MNAQDEQVELDGQVYVTARRGAELLGDDVNEALIRDWQRRGLTPSSAKVGNRRWYQLAELQNAELATFGRTRARTDQT
jgi:DNA-binding transcriptional MerR regulator